MTNPPALPQCYWYTSKRHVEGHNKAYYFKGKQYFGYTDEPSYGEIEQYDLRYVGAGDIYLIEGVN